MQISWSIAKYTTFGESKYSVFRATSIGTFCLVLYTLYTYCVLAVRIVCFHVYLFFFVCFVRHIFCFFLSSILTVRFFYFLLFLLFSSIQFSVLVAFCLFLFLTRVYVCVCGYFRFDYWITYNLQGQNKWIHWISKPFCCFPFLSHSLSHDCETPFLFLSFVLCCGFLFRRTKEKNKVSQLNVKPKRKREKF